MPLKLILALALGAASGLAFATPPARLTDGQARHLLVRTGFAPSQAEVNALTGQTARVAVSRLLVQAKANAPLQSGYAAPDFVSQAPLTLCRLLKSCEKQQAQRQQQLREDLDMKIWWLREMVVSPTPLRERMTLFWHNHFATSQQKVNRSQAMWKQQQVLRTHALGNFRSLLHDVAKDPAMLIYLHGANSRKEAPNEKFAREVMELFTFGEATDGGAVHRT